MNVDYKTLEDGIKSEYDMLIGGILILEKQKLQNGLVRKEHYPFLRIKELNF